MEEKTAKRIADALEELVELNKQPLIEIETLPPRCPHCGHVDPQILIPEEAQAATGKLSSYVVIGDCSHCKKPIFAAANQWQIFESVEDIKAQLTQMEN